MVHILNLYICDLVLLFHIDTEGKCRWILGGVKGMLPPSPKLLWGEALFLRLCNITSDFLKHNFSRVI